MPEQPPPAAPASAGTCVISSGPRAFQNEQLPETRWLRLAGSAGRDRPLACCPDCREVAFDGDVVESERNVQAHVSKAASYVAVSCCLPTTVWGSGCMPAALPVYWLTSPATSAGASRSP